MAKLVMRPAAYAAWAAMVVAALGLSYSGDPYVFGLVALAAGCATLIIALVAVMVVMVQRSLSPVARIAMLFWVTVAGAAVLLALRALRQVSWS